MRKCQAIWGHLGKTLVYALCQYIFGMTLVRYSGQSDTRTLVLAADMTRLPDRFTVLSMSVVVLGCAILVAWRIQKSATRTN